MHSSAGNLAALLDADLIDGGWDGSIDPYPGMSARNFACQHLRRSLIKKFHNNEVSDERNRKALDLFEKSNKACADYVTPDPATYDNLLAIALGEAKSFLWDFCNPGRGDDILLTLNRIERHVGFGKGASIGAKSGDPYGKLAISQLSYTDPALLVLFEQTIRSLPLWAEQEQFRSKSLKSRIVQGSRISFVPKTSEITRSICTEPILNMFYQKGIAGVLEKRLREVIGIDLSTQPEKNRLLARIGSETGKFGTIDLSSASDSLSLTVVREFFPDHMVRWLELTRCKKTILTDGRVIDLHMVSSMGNAFTFPLQTLFFSSLVIGAYRAYDKKIIYPRNTVGNFAVFGDDIIVEQDCYDLVCRMLTHCGFTVNYDKSFNSGLFRESCGHDYYQGHNVRGVYITKLLDDLDRYSAFNRLSRWSLRNKVPLIRVLTYLVKGVGKVLFVPLYEDDEAGFKVPFTHAREYVKYSRKQQNYVYVFARRKPCMYKLPSTELDFKAIRRLKRAIPGWFYNPAGLLLLVLHGNVRNGHLVLRLETVKSEYCKRTSSCWDYSDYDVGEIQRLRSLTAVIFPS